MTARFVLRMTNPGLRKHAFHRRFVWHASFPSRTREPVERHFNCLRAARAFVFNPTVEAFNRYVEEKNFLTMLTITVSSIMMQTQKHLDSSNSSCSRPWRCFETRHTAGP